MVRKMHFHKGVLLVLFLGEETRNSECKNVVRVKGGLISLPAECT